MRDKLLTTIMGFIYSAALLGFGVGAAVIISDVLHHDYKADDIKHCMRDIPHAIFISDDWVTARYVVTQRNVTSDFSDLFSDISLYTTKPGYMSAVTYGHTRRSPLWFKGMGPLYISEKIEYINPTDEPFRADLNDLTACVRKILPERQP